MYKLVTKFVKKWMRREHITDAMLLQALRNLEVGLSSANLGSSLFKVRVARKGQGKSSGYRTLIVYRQTTGLSLSMDSRNPMLTTSRTTNSSSSGNLPLLC